MAPAEVPFNDLQRLFAANDQALSAAVKRVMASGWWLNGRELELFCDDFRSYLKINHCIGVANGTDALEIGMRAIAALRNQAGREVVTVANAGGYSTIACRLAELTPVYADIEQASQLVDLASIMSCVNSQTVLVVVTHLYGGVVDVPRLRSLLDADGFSHVPILEDCAQAHGARLGDRLVGTMGDLATFSFYPTKNLGALGDGGAIVTDSAALADAVASLRQYGWSQKYKIAIDGGRNSRLDEIQAAVLCVLLPHLDDGNARRRAIIDRYRSAAPSTITIVDGGPGAVGHLAILLTPDRDRLRRHLAAGGIATEIHYPLLDCDQPGWKDLPQRVAPSGLAVSRSSVPQLLTLPCFPQLSDREIDKVCRSLSGWETQS